MAIYINYTNKSLDFYIEDDEKLKKLKEVCDAYQRINFEEDKTTFVTEDDSNEVEESGENAQNVENDAENEQNNNIKINESNFDIEEKNKLNFKLNGNYVNLENFTDDFLNNNIVFPDELLQYLKEEKQVVVLPDDVVTFDYLVTPILNFWKMKQAVNLKLSIDYKDFVDFGKDYKVMNKIKPNSIYAVQLVKQEIVKRFTNYFTNLGVKVKNTNFYSGTLANFYTSHLRGAKNASIIVKVGENKTTIFAIVHGFVVCSETLYVGEKEVYKNSTYKFDEYSRRSISHKFVCYSVSQISDGGSEVKLTRDQIEKSYSKTKTNPLAGNFQFKSINIVDLIQKKIDDMKMFLASSELKIQIENVFVDVKNDETFAKLRLPDAVKVYYPECDIFKTQKQSKLFNFNTVGTKINKKGFFGGNLWSKGKKKA